MGARVQTVAALGASWAPEPCPRLLLLCCHRLTFRTDELLVRGVKHEHRSPRSRLAPRLKLTRVWGWRGWR